ncbi:MAG: pyruvate:ferredoxin (flavodoxin) oxidoreductase [Clostridia bacterium]|nr:pyruvate:ferredoxin (flavodoxin) oxidoreductase [Clostridia bacterium]
MAVKMTVDGNTAVSHVAYAFSDVAAIYPITPSSPMAEVADVWAAENRKNIFGQTVKIQEMQSEAGAAGAVHGSLSAGAMTTTFTASQGLLLMIPNMYKIAGELTPSVFHVSARALAYHALNIFGDHSDVMACRQTGFAMLASNSVQEAHDMALVAHIATLKSSVPFLHFFDGFRTSHEIQKIDAIDKKNNYEELKALVPWDKIDEFRARALNPEHPHQAGTAQNSDIYFQGREACNKFYDAVPDIVAEVMDDVAKVIGRSYKPFQYEGAPDAEYVIISMGSSCDAIHETVNKLNESGAKVGVIKCHLYRPFSVKYLMAVMPESVKKIAVLDRTKESGSLGEPLYLDVCTALVEAGRTDIKVVGGRYGLGSKEFTPTMVKAVFDNLTGEMKNHFTVGIVDDVTGSSLPLGETFAAAPAGTSACMFYGLGSDGTVGANKNSIKIIGDHTDKYAQAYFFYDSKKSGGLTVSHLRFGDTPIQSPYLIDVADFIACSNPAYVTMYDMVTALRDGGTFLLNCQWSPEELDERLPAKMKNLLAKKHAKFYIINAIDLAIKVGMRGRTNTTMQAAFFKLANIIPYEDADKYMKEKVVASYGKKGQDIVNMNFAAIDAATDGLVEVKIPESWATTTTGAEAVMAPGATEYFKTFVDPVLKQEGNALPVSMLDPRGIVPTGTTKFEKRGIAVTVPEWNPELCVSCGYCSIVCPHAAIRTIYTADGADVPEGYVTKKGIGKEFAGLNLRVQVSPLDCTGCGNCVDVCLGKKKDDPTVKALTMKPLDSQRKEEANWEYAMTVPEIADRIANKATVKNSQALKPLFEFSGACAGCGETPYVKLVTQLFGDRMIVANATGCSSIYGGSAPTCPYTTNEKGFGPAWSNSLFEDNAEFGFGMNLAVSQRREKLAEVIAEVVEVGKDEAIVAAAKEWLENKDDAEGSRKAGDKLVALLEPKDCGGERRKFILDNKDLLTKKSIWIFGGDGWAYDIGYGGVDHVLAQNQDVNILVLDTEVYSNTGGQASKATPTGSVAKFAAAGKRTKKKDLGMMAMSYGYVYVAQVAMSDPAQVLKAMIEAEAYHGPSLIIAYAPCINHGLRAKGGMGKAQAEIKKAVACGYWQTYRFNPDLAAQGKNPMTVDSKDPTGDYQEFLKGEVRYTSLAQQFPEAAEKLFAQQEEDAKERRESYKKLAAQA